MLAVVRESDPNQIYYAVPYEKFNVNQLLYLQLRVVNITAPQNSRRGNTKQKSFSPQKGRKAFMNIQNSSMLTSRYQDHSSKRYRLPSASL